MERLYYYIILLILHVLLVCVCGAEIGSRRLPKQPAGICSSSRCNSAQCLCSQQVTPFGWSPSEVPQMILVTFQQSLSDQAYKTYYKPLFDGLINPNKCQAKGTFFVDHKYTDYSTVHQAWSEGHDFQARSITGMAWNENSDYSVVFNEIAGIKHYLELYGQLPSGEVVGARSPGMQSAGDAQVEAIRNASMLFDDSLTSRASAKPYWPYTLDFRSTQDSQGGPIPKNSYPGFWEFPVTDFVDGNNNVCNNLQACIYNNTMANALELLRANFRNYRSQSTPFIVTAPLSWLIDSANANGLKQFLEEALNGSNRPYIVTMSQALAWFKSPVKVAQIDKFQPWSCPAPKPNTCNRLTCQYTVSFESLNFVFCTSNSTWVCPDSYPWIDNLPWVKKNKLK